MISFPQAPGPAAGRRDLGFRWLGPGATGLLVPLRGADAAGRPGEARSVTSTEALDRLLEEEGAGADEAERVRHAAAPFFAAGGRALHVVVCESDPRRWIGEDGGPGERSGLHTFRDVEEVTTVVVPGVTGAQRDELIAFGRRLPDLTFWLAETGGPAPGASGEGPPPARAPEIRWPAPNVLWVLGLAAAPAALALAGALEARDPRGGRTAPGGGARPASRRGPLPPEAEAAVALLGCHPALEALSDRRLGAGLRRSLDHGSRWVVFAPDHAFVRRRLERETRAFLHDLAVDGILPGAAAATAEVRCVGVPGEPGRVRLVVRIGVPEEIEVEARPGRSGEGTASPAGPPGAA